MKSQHSHSAARILSTFCIGTALLFTGLVNAVWTFRNNRELRDFGSFVAAGQEAVKGNNPYQQKDSLVFSVEFPDQGIKVASPNLNPPVSVLLFQPLAYVDPVHALAIWRLITVLGYCLALLLLFQTGDKQISLIKMGWAFSLAGFWHLIELGQIYMPLLLACVIAWRLLGAGRTISAGILIGLLIAIKPNFAVWAAALFLAGYWPAALAGAITAGAFSLVPLVLYGQTIYQEWFHALAQFNGYAIPVNSSLIGFFARIGYEQVGVGLSVLLMIIFGFLIWRKRPSALITSALALVATLLVSPIAWVGYTILLLPVFLEHDWTPTVRMAAALLVVPVPVILMLTFIDNAAMFLWSGLYALALALLFAAILRDFTKRAGTLQSPTANGP